MPTAERTREDRSRLGYCTITVKTLGSRTRTIQGGWGRAELVPAELSFLVDYISSFSFPGSRLGTQCGAGSPRIPSAVLPSVLPSAAADEGRVIGGVFSPPKPEYIAAFTLCRRLSRFRSQPYGRLHPPFPAHRGGSPL